MKKVNDMIDARHFFAKVCMLVFFFVALPVAMVAQVEVSGTVIDSHNEPVIGATVIEKGNPKNATVTDFDGNFKFKVPSGKKIVISYIGMIAQELSAGKDLKVTMQDDNTSLEDVVVIGYTSKARKDLTGSVGSISGQKLAVVPVASAAEALSGKIAGVQVTTVDGQPGADINIRVRGASSVTGSNDPLFIVDGFQVPNINDIPPSDIASIDVLKDASLTAIYGAKGANGVVVVTTKSAQSGKVTVTFNGRLSVSHITKQLDLMNSNDFVKYQYDRAVSNSTRGNYADAFRANFGHPFDVYSNYYVPTHNWQDEVMGNTPLSYQANLNIGGGNETTKFNLSLTQSEDNGIISGSGVRRTNINFKLNTKLHKNLELTYNPKMTFRYDDGAGGDNVGSGGIIDVLRYRPTGGLREWGSYNGVDASGNPIIVESDDVARDFELTNPINDIDTNIQKKRSYTITNQVSLKWTPIKGLILRSEANYTIGVSDTKRFYGANTSTGKSNNNLPVANIGKTTRQSYTWTNTASYDFDIDDTNNLSFLLGQEIYSSWSESSTQQNRYFPKGISATDAFNNMGLGTAQTSSSSLSTPDKTASFFGQINYNYDHKYLVSGTLRADGSSKFAPGNQWGYFPSLSGAWVISKEKFLKDVKWIDQLKLRFAWGMVGNNRIADDLWRQVYTPTSNGGPGFGEASANGEKYYTTGSTLANKDIKWETTITRNLAADFSILGGRLSITPEIYWKTTKDLLYSAIIDPTAGYSRQQQNIGKVTNNGWELTVNGDILRGKDYVLSGNFTLGHNKMKVVELSKGDNSIPQVASKWKSADEDDYRLEVGQEVGLMYGYIYDGLYSFDEFVFNESTKKCEPKAQQFVDGVLVSGTVINNVLGSSPSGDATLPGKIKLKDINGDGVVDKNDKVVIGNTTPKFQGGFGLSGQYKNFDFTCNFTYMIDFDVYNATAYALSANLNNSATSFFNVLDKFAGNRWTYVDASGSFEASKPDYNEGFGHGLYGNTTSIYTDPTAYELYQSLNEGKTMWNPADLTTRAMLSNFVENASFVRLADITIGYNLPKNIVKKLSLSKARIYMSAGNLFTITNYSGYDPEVDVQSGLAPSMDYNRYPRSRTWSFGVNVTF